MVWVLVAFIVASSFIFCSAFAIGITPGRTTIDFQPGFEKDFHFTVINNEHKEMDVVIYVKPGPLNDTVILYDNIVHFKPDENEKGFRYTMKLPDEIKEPGSNMVNIVAMELPSKKGDEGAFVGATTAVITQLLIRVPYPGKYATVDLAVSESQAGEPVNFFVNAMNLGTENILKAGATIDILGPTNEKIATVETAEEGICSKCSKEFKATWEADVNPGLYHAVVTLRYDGEVSKAEKNFAVGNKYIDVDSITVKDFRLGAVAKFNIMIESKWNDKIGGVYGIMSIKDTEGGKVAEVQTASVDVEPFEKKEIYAYWDTEGVKAGTYDASLVLNYEGRTTEKDLKAHVDLSQIRVDILGLGIGAVTVEPAAGGGMNNMIILLVVVLVGINAGWFMYFKRRGRA